MYGKLKRADNKKVKRTAGAAAYLARYAARGKLRTMRKDLMETGTFLRTALIVLAVLVVACGPEPTTLESREPKLLADGTAHIDDGDTLGVSVGPGQHAFFTHVDMKMYEDECYLKVQIYKYRKTPFYIIFEPSHFRMPKDSEVIFDFVSWAARSPDYKEGKGLAFAHSSTTFRCDDVENFQSIERGTVRELARSLELPNNRKYVGRDYGAAPIEAFYYYVASGAHSVLPRFVLGEQDEFDNYE